MEDLLEGFVIHCKKEFPRINFPDKITKENVNDIIYENQYTRQFTILDVVIQRDVGTSKFGKVISILLELGAMISSGCLVYCERIILPLLFDYGANPNMKLAFRDHSLLDILYIERDSYLCKLSIDYGAKIPKDWDKERSNLRGDLIEYAHLSNRRVQECKRCLLTTLYVCKVSPFRPVGEILLSAARQTWTMRGGEGVGPRGHNWSIN